MPYDEKCYELAEHFLSAIPNLSDTAIEDLAQELQNCCDDFLSDLEDEESEDEEDEEGEDEDDEDEEKKP